MGAPHLDSGEVIVIPRTSTSPAHLDSIAERYKNVRLHGLRVDPQSFSSTYEFESQFSSDVWLSRIQNPLGKTFAAVIDSDAKSNDQISDSCLSGIEGAPDTVQGLLSKEWVGIATLIGPVPFSSEESNTTNRKPWDTFIKDGKYQIPSKAVEPDKLNGAHIVYVIVGMFVLPHARRKGHARRLLEAIVNAAEEESKCFAALKTSITVQAEPGNLGAKQLYERVGFEVWDDVLIENRRGGSSRAVSLVMEIDGHT
jgi:RimJ/RimL family protein N-acetyltransferase